MRRNVTPAPGPLPGERCYLQGEGEIGATGRHGSYYGTAKVPMSPSGLRWVLRQLRLAPGIGKATVTASCWVGGSPSWPIGEAVDWPEGWEQPHARYRSAFRSIMDCELRQKPRKGKGPKTRPLRCRWTSLGLQLRRARRV